uniref:Uncharacterized protein n=1 Tax=Meloidogyne enterolobii TaxID=390850 RepID=A0A6V7YCA0_MELEN|nr:unnamed protein product [Meloidogyne enterolobii]
MITGKKLNESNSIIIQIIYISQFYLILTSLDNKRELDNLISIDDRLDHYRYSPSKGVFLS